MIKNIIKVALDGNNFNVMFWFMPRAKHVLRRLSWTLDILRASAFVSSACFLGFLALLQLVFVREVRGQRGTNARGR